MAKRKISHREEDYLEEKVSPGIHKKIKKLEKKKTKPKTKVEKVLREYKEGKLHSGSKKGPKVKSRKQAVAIALSEARKVGAKVPKKKKK
jgi:sulfur relay (sulfurtransferase) DsrC/TusE family protein